MRKFVSLFLLVALCVFNVQAATKVKEGAKAKYVFYFIGDGMGLNQINATEIFLAEQNGRIGVEQLNFTQFPAIGYATSYSSKNAVTCSAASGTALATGHKTKNGTIGMDETHSEPYYSVAVKAKELGKKVGIGTTVSIDHATPAAFYAHQADRDMYYEIATDLPKSGFDFFGGSGFLNPQKEGKESIFNLFKDAGYDCAYGYAQAADMVKSSGKLIMMNNKGASNVSLPLAIDRRDGDLTMAQITECAIDMLSKDSKNGFFLMMEGGQIDWCGHSYDAASNFKEVIDLHSAIDVALKFYEEHPNETLIVVTADHETGGLMLGVGPYELHLSLLANQRCSKSELTNQILALRAAKGSDVSWEECKDILSKNTGLFSKVVVPEADEKELYRRYKEAFIDGKDNNKSSMYYTNAALAEYAVDVLNKLALVGWNGGSHTAAYVPVFAIGASSELFRGRMDNTDIPKRISQAMSK